MLLFIEQVILPGTVSLPPCFGLPEVGMSSLQPDSWLLGNMTTHVLCGMFPPILSLKGVDRL